MRMSELSRTTGVAVATIKYYLREGLVPPGTATAPNQADYGDHHVRRLRLIRALREVGELGIEAIRAVVTAIDDAERPLHHVLGVAHRALAPAVEAAPAEAGEIDGLLGDLGWRVAAGSPDREMLAHALSLLRGLGWQIDATAFLPYARAVESIAADEVGRVPAFPSASRDTAVERAVVGTVVFEQVLCALRRLAQEHASASSLASGNAQSG